MLGPDGEGGVEWGWGTVSYKVKNYISANATFAYQPVSSAQLQPQECCHIYMELRSNFGHIDWLQ